MKTHLIVAVVSAGVLAGVAVSCGGGGGGGGFLPDGGLDGATGGSSFGGGSGSGGSNLDGGGTGGGNTGGGGSGGTGGSQCLPGGSTCVSFDECCSGTCANQVCTECAGVGSDCSEGCCSNLFCNEGLCSTCKPSSETCTLASDCCSNICQNGACAECAPGGDACTTSSECCNGLGCNAGTCCNSSGGTCSTESDCCTGYDCINGSCQVPCGTSGASCSTSGQCCTGLTCQSGSCQTPCLPSGSGCSTSSQCCSGLTCQNGSCQTPCVGSGSFCSTSSQCCTGLTCTNNSCQTPCVGSGSFCSTSSQCCTGLTCTNNSCQTPSACGTTYFSDNFSGTQGWTLDSTWQIGAALASTCGSSSSGNDPSTDHTATTTDNRIAGVNIGSCYSTTASSINYCMTSPNINTASAATLWVSYYRHLHTDYPSFVYSTIDVSSNGGSTWNNIYSNPSSNWVNDLAWMPFQYNVTTYKSSTFRVRFCYSPSGSGIAAGGGWNIDDVVVSSNACP